MCRDIELLLGNKVFGADFGVSEAASPRKAVGTLGPAKVEVKLGFIESFLTDEPASVVALPANEYFDDDCIKNTTSALGAYVGRAYGSSLDAFIGEVRLQLQDAASQRVPRKEGRIEDSYGIGHGLFVGSLSPSHKVILVSATTERIGIGLRAEPHFLYAAIQGIFETMNDNNLKSVVLPVMGSDHGVMPLRLALLFNLLALRSLLKDDVGRRIRRVQIVVFQGAGEEVSGAMLHDLLAFVAELRG